MLFKEGEPFKEGETENGSVSKFTLILEHRANKATHSISSGLVQIFRITLFLLSFFKKHIYTIQS